jgi:hypothetical protein
VNFTIICILDTIVLRFAIGLRKVVAMIFAVSFEIIIQRAVGNEPCYLIKKKYNRRKNHFYFMSD